MDIRSTDRRIREQVRARALSALLVGSVLACQVPLSAQTALHPIGGPRGASFEVEVLEANLKGAFDALFCCDDLRATVRVEEVEGGPARVFLHVEVDPQAKLGAHVLQLLSDEGLSKRLTLQVNAEPHVAEQDGPHHAPSQAQLIEFPAVVNGRLSEDGEVDYYAVEVAAGQEFRFEVITASGLIPENSQKPLFKDPVFTLYEPSGSWFDPHRAIRLKPDDESTSFFFLGSQVILGSHPVYLPRLTYRFEKSGWHLLRVGAIGDVGGPDYGYQLRVVPTDGATSETPPRWTPRELVHKHSVVWEEREFAGRIAPDWLEQLRSRSVGDQAPAHDAEELQTIREEEPNDDPDQALAVGCASVIEGNIGRPGDVDHFKFKVEDGRRLAFEIRTPELGPPRFHPWLTLLEEGKDEPFLANFYRRVVNGTPIWVKSPQPKTIYTFEEAGDAILRVRDLTSRVGDERCAYQIVIRPQIPHVGKVAAVEVNKTGLNRRDPLTRLNLKAGQSKKLSVITEREEGFEGEIALRLEDLPEGVEALPAGSIDPDVAATGNVFETLGAIDKSNFRPDRRVDSIVLTASEDAGTTMPRLVRLIAMPIVGGQVGDPLHVQDIPMMVVK